MNREMPVYLFTGFLEAGKTKFIQETMEDPAFNSGEKTLILLCEEGVEELDFSRFSSPNAALEILEEQEQINSEYLAALEKRHSPERIIIEYNGMWLLDRLFTEMPPSWVIYQEFCFADAGSFVSYNQNMRQLVYDKLKSADCVIFNRYRADMDKLPLHKIVRGVSRRPDIYYELPSGDAIIDDIVDPMPFDINAPVIEIADSDYALWYRDLDENMDAYRGKTVKFKGITGVSTALSGGDFVIGRQVMTCCVDDIQMAGLACRWNGPRPARRQWKMITAKIKIEESPAYGGKIGPVLLVTAMDNADEPYDPVATFY